MKKVILFLIMILSIVTVSCLGMFPDDYEYTDAGGDSDSTIVYITDTGEKYHRGSCGYLHSSKIAVSLSSAKSRGYTPCSRCNPPRGLFLIETDELLNQDIEPIQKAVNQ